MISVEPQSPGRLSGNLDEILDAYRVPLTIATFGLLFTFIGFFISISRAADRVDREFGAEVAEVSSIITSRLDLVAVELDQIANGMDAGLPDDVMASVFASHDFHQAALGIELLYFERQGRTTFLIGSAAALPEVGVVPGLAAGFDVEADPETGQIAFQRTAGTGSVVALTALARLLPADVNSLNASLPEPVEPGSAAAPPPMSPQPYMRLWRAPSPFEGLQVLFSSRSSSVFDVGVVPWFVLGLGLVSTVALFLISYSEARKAIDVRLEVARKTAELIRSNAVIARKNKELERFAAHASHDLQAPLRGMKGWSDALRRRDENLDEESRTFLDRISSSADRAQSLVQSLLDYTAAEHRKLNFEQIDLDLLGAEVSEMLAAPISERGATVSWDWHAPLVGDRFLVTRLVLNLVSNALKYCDERTPQVTVSTERTGKATRLTVRDNGIGIAEEHLDLIFEAFSRLHGRGEYEGHGLGLAMCARIVKLHGGVIEVESTPGEGSEFRVTFPQRAASDRPAERTAI